MKIRPQLASSLSKTSGLGNPGTTVTIHETGNRTPGAGAQAHANLQSKGNVRTASWHWTVDDEYAFQSFDTSVKCWHAGTNAGNNTSVGIEICVNPDSDFVQACRNAAVIAAMILRSKGRGVESLRLHRDWSSKNCPTNILSGQHGVTWEQFKSWVNDELSGTVAPVPSIPAPATVVEEITDMKLWHTLTPWGERIFGYTTASAGAGTLDVNVFQHRAQFWPAVEVDFAAMGTEIREAWALAGADADFIAARVAEVLDPPESVLN